MKPYFQVSDKLSDEIPIFVYLVKGSAYSVWIDSGVRSMFPLLLQGMREANVGSSDLRFILHTHSHHDHIGCNRQLKEASGCLIAATGYYEAWHRDFERHYQEFARVFPELTPDTEALRKEVFDPLDGEAALDLVIGEGNIFNLGGGVILEAFSFPGHMKSELGYLEHSSNTLILGDAITGLDWPIFHSHLDVQGYRSSLRKIRSLIECRGINEVLFAHFEPRTGTETLQLIEKAEQYLDEIEYHILSILVEERSVTLQEAWLQLAERMNRAPEFRALNTANAHLEDLLERKVIKRLGSNQYGLRGT